MRVIISLCLLTLAVCTVTTPLRAEENPAEMAQALKEEVNILSENLSEQSKAHFLTMYGNHNLIRTVEIVRNDVGIAVAACGENNPDIKEKMATRFTEWKGAVDPVVDEAKSHLENMILVQDYVDVQQIHDLFRKVDDTRDAVQNQIEKKPVTSKEACLSLHDKMADTQQNMVQLLRSTLISLPEMRFGKGQQIEEKIPEGSANTSNAEEPKEEASETVGVPEGKSSEEQSAENSKAEEVQQKEAEQSSPAVEVEEEQETEK